ncbi:MAG: FISUMP domain-containing protein [Bacteroidales bacterium]|nr:FISUMP domain-containing protein [Bacteroidales bacterium]
MMSEAIVDSTFAPTTYEDLQLGPDLKIYTPIFSKDSVGVIHNPEIYGSGCNFQKNAIGLNGNNVYYGLPQFLQKYKAYLHYLGSGCQSDSLHFSGDIWPPADTIRWNFGDPASGGSNVSFLATPAHLFSNPGTYTVELYVRHNDNRTDTSWRTITIYPSPATSAGPDQTICTGNTATFDAGFCLGCTYEWKNVGTGLVVGNSQTFITGTAGNYCVKVTNGNACSGYDTAQLITTSVPQVTNNQLTKSICSGESTNISLTSNVTGTMFHWTSSLTSGNITGFSADSGLVINQILIDNLPTPGSVKYTVTPKVGNCSGTPVDFTVTVNPGDSVKVSITASGNNICSGTPVTFTAVPTNPGTSPAYQWKVNGSNAGGNSPVFTYTPVNGDQIQCILTSSITVCISNNPASSNIISMIVNPLLPVSVSISASSNPFCIGTSVTFTAAPVNGGPLAGYQWKVNGVNAGTNSPNFTFNPISGDVVTCLLNSSLACVSGNPATSNALVMTGIPGLPASVSITANPNPFCPGSSVTFTATPANGGTNPSYQWKVNGLNAGTNSSTFTYNPLNNDSVRCVMTSTLSCVSSNPATSNKIILSGSLAPLITFTPCFDTITTLNAKPIKLKGGIPLNGIYSGAGVSAGIFDPAVAGIGTKTITYTYTNVFQCSANKSKTIIVQATAPFICGNMLNDIRDGKTYPTVQIGTQCWMAANLNRGAQIPSSQVQFDNCIDEKFCYGNDPVKCSKYGGLYQWDEMMRYDDVPAGQGICPPGWHIPTENDWTVLCNYYNGFGFAGKPLQDTFISGFRALTGGVFYLNSSWSFEDFAVLFWTSSSWGSYKALSHGMNTINFSVSLYPSSRSNAFPIRCLHD